MGSPRQDITLEERMGMAVTAAANRGVYGVVSCLAREYRTSRQFIYSLEKRVLTAVEEALAPRKPGPAANSLLLEIDRAHLDQSILALGMVGHASERAIAECLGTILGVEPSLGYVSGVLTRASRAATQFNQTLRLPLPDAEVGLDELYAQKKGKLVAIHPDSLLILALKETQRVDGRSWGETMDEMASRGVQIARVASDGGAAIRAMVARLDRVAHHLDLWHALRHVGRSVGALERAAYKAIAKEEEERRKKAGRLPNSPMMGGVVHEDYHRARREATVAIERYEALRLLAVWARQALDPIEASSGRVRTRQECLGELHAATELMRELAVPVARKLADYLDSAGPGLLAYVDRTPAAGGTDGCRVGGARGGLPVPRVATGAEPGQPEGRGQGEQAEGLPSGSSHLPALLDRRLFASKEEGGTDPGIGSAGKLPRRVHQLPPSALRRTQEEPRSRLPGPVHLLSQQPRLCPRQAGRRLPLPASRHPDTQGRLDGVARLRAGSVPSPLGSLPAQSRMNCNSIHPPS